MKKTTKGGATIKVINGRKYYYYQWRENGVNKSRTITEEEYYRIVSEKENNQTSIRDYLNGIKYLTGNNLLDSISFVSSWDKRDCFDVLEKYIDSPCNGKVMILYGLRRTGKTSLMFQSILNHKDEVDKTAYLLVNKNNTMGDINLTLNNLVKNGFKYVYIDEVTLAEDFISSSQFLSDIYALRMKIVLSGTDSLGFSFAVSNELYDRNYIVHTTYIPFKEFSHLLKINDIDKYIEYGGTLVGEGLDYHNDNYPSFYNKETAQTYIDTAISQNIQNSLEKYQDGKNFKRIKSLKDENELTSLINKVVQDNNHRFVAKILNRVFKSQDYGSLRQILRNNNDENIRTVMETIDENEIYQSLMKKLSIHNNEVDQETVDELYRYFKVLDIVEDVSVMDLDNNLVYKETILAQPGLRYAIARELIETLLYEGELLNLPNYVIDVIFETLLNDVKGRILEEIVILNEMKKDINKVCKLSFLDGEIDMCLIDKTQQRCSIFEIKHSKEIDKNQARHLLDEHKVSLIKYRFGNISNKYVLYRGESINKDDVQYDNVEKFLLGL